MTISSAALERHLHHDRSDSPVVMGPCVVSPQDDDAIEMRLFYEARHNRLAASREVTDAGDCSFANTSAPRELLLRHRFDEGFRGYGMEDYDLCVRLLVDGIRIGFDPDAVIFHHAATSRRARLGQLREEGANRVRFVRRHPDDSGAAFVAEPARFERLVRSIARPRTALTLWKLAGVVERLGDVPAAGKHRLRLRYWADTCAVYSGVAGATPTENALTIVIPAHNASATITRAGESGASDIDDVGGRRRRRRLGRRHR